MMFRQNKKQPLSVRGWTSAFLLDVRGLCGAIEEEIEPFSVTLAQIGLAECDRRGKNPTNSVRRYIGSLP